MAGCNLFHNHQHRKITMEALADMQVPAFAFDANAIRSHLHVMAVKDAGPTVADRRTRDYYREGVRPLVWVSRLGVDARPDSLLLWLHLVGQMGFSERAFCVSLIEQDLERMRTLDFDEADNTINHVAARLEFNLTKAYLRYAYGQRFGFMDPHVVFNRLDPRKTDDAGRVITYRGLYDVPIDRPDKDYYAEALRKAAPHSLAAYLREIQPTDTLYQRLMAQLPASTAEHRKRVLVNMERSRWRQHDDADGEGKCVIVNVPALSLYALSPDTAFEMRIACGTVENKTPLLSSRIDWLEVNPQWVIPMSIIENEVAPHAGDSAYFARNRYHITDRATGEELPVEEVSRAMLLSGDYKVAQENGEGNSLGRLIFRFPNNFAVFLHDTSSRGVFNRDSRNVSHGCVRIQRPFDLACFVLDAPEERLLERIRLSMGLSPETEWGRTYLRNHSDEQPLRLVNWVPVKPSIPIHIIYYTLYPDLQGQLQSYPDVYRYDDVIWNCLQPYL